MGDPDEGVLYGGGYDGVDIDGIAILSQAHRVVTAHWVSRPLMSITLIDGSTYNMQPIRFP